MAVTRCIKKIFGTVKLTSTSVRQQKRKRSFASVRPRVCFMSRCHALTGNSIRHRCFYKWRATLTPCVHSSSSHYWSKLQFKLCLTVTTPKTTPRNGDTKLKGLPGNIVLCMPIGFTGIFHPEFFFSFFAQYKVWKFQSNSVKIA